MATLELSARERMLLRAATALVLVLAVLLPCMRLLAHIAKMLRRRRLKRAAVPSSLQRLWGAACVPGGSSTDAGSELALGARLTRVCTARLLPSDGVDLPWPVAGRFQVQRKLTLHALPAVQGAQEPVAMCAIGFNFGCCTAQHANIVHSPAAERTRITVSCSLQMHVCALWMGAVNGER